MSSKGIMRRARRLGLVVVLVLGPLVVSAQTPPAHAQDDLDVTMRVIADPNAKVPDEIVRRIPLPKPAQATPASGKPADKPSPADKPDDKAKGPDAAKPPEPGRDFGQGVADDAKQRADEAKRAKPDTAGKPPNPPGKPPDPPGKPPSPPGKPPG
jgi:hypothetical protein